MAIPLLAIAFIPIRRAAKPADSIGISIGSVLYSLLVLLIVVNSADSLPALYVQGEGLTWLERCIQYAIIALFAIGAIRYWYLGKSREDSTYSYLAAALMVGVFEELSFTLYASAYDLINLMGYVFGFFSFLFIFMALLRESVIVPYQKLGRTRKELEKEHEALVRAYEKLEIRTKEVEEARTKVQSYLDFFAHDIANIISPLMVYAEMLSQDEGQSPKDKELADAILEGIDRAGAFIANLRHLAAAEAVAPSEFVGIDVVHAINEIEEVLRQTHRGKSFSIIWLTPPGTRIFVAGGEHVEDVLYEILKNALSNSAGDAVKVMIDAKQIQNSQGRLFWQLGIVGTAWRISKEARESTDVILDPRMRFRRGVASDFTFFSTIMNHFGGRLQIEKIGDSNLEEGFRVTIELPAVETMKP